MVYFVTCLASFNEAIIQGDAPSYLANPSYLSYETSRDPRAVWSVHGSARTPGSPSMTIWRARRAWATKRGARMQISDSTW